MQEKIQLQVVLFLSCQCPQQHAMQTPIKWSGQFWLGFWKIWVNFISWLNGLYGATLFYGHVHNMQKQGLTYLPLQSDITNVSECSTVQYDRSITDQLGVSRSQTDSVTGLHLGKNCMWSCNTSKMAASWHCHVEAHWENPDKFVLKKTELWMMAEKQPNDL